MNICKLVTNAHFPSFNNSITQEISGQLDVKGAAIDASSLDKEIPTSATLSAELHTLIL